LKEEYNALNNYFIKEENENRNEFEECLETFHYSFNGIKSEKIDKNEFCQFYFFISFLIQEEDDFIELISNEWRVHINNQILDNINKGDKTYKEILNEENCKNLNNINLNEYKTENIKDTRHIRNKLNKKIDSNKAKEIQNDKNEYDELYSKE
jgi:hypothetical protein